MRVRMIRPAYWTDADLHTRLSAEQREFYIGLWMLADDAGYVPWDLDRVGAELYPYRDLAWRRDTLPGWLEVLAPHARMLSCGQHVLVPTLSRHQSPPKPSYQNRTAHERTCSQVVPLGATGDQRAPARGFSKEGKGIGKGAPAGANGSTTDDEEATGIGLVRAAVAAIAGAKP